MLGVIILSCDFLTVATPLSVFLWNFTSEGGWVCFISALSAQMQTENVAAMHYARFVLQTLL